MLKKLKMAQVVFTLMVGAVGCAADEDPPKPEHPTVVTSFDNGFVAAKEDDCEQGFQPACSWLAESH